MTRKQVLTGLMAAVTGVVVSWGWSGCGSGEDDHPAHVGSRPAAATGPTATQIANDLRDSRMAGLTRIPDLGVATPTTMPDGKVWQKYPNGLAYLVIHDGNGPIPELGQNVSVAYVGTFPETGKVFDEKSAQDPMTHRLGDNNLVKGWNMALSTMHAGTTRKFWLPAQLAYGVRGSMPKINPNQPLIFELQLLKVTGEPILFPDAPPLAPATEPAVPDSATQMGPVLPAATSQAK